MKELIKYNEYNTVASQEIENYTTMSIDIQNIFACKTYEKLKMLNTKGFNKELQRYCLLFLKHYNLTNEVIDYRFINVGIIRNSDGSFEIGYSDSDKSLPVAFIDELEKHWDSFN